MNGDIMSGRLSVHSLVAAYAPYPHPVEANDGCQTSGAQLEVLALSLGLVVGEVLGWCSALVKLQNPKLAASIPRVGGE